MRILLVTWEFPPETVGGVGAHVEGLSQSLAKDGHEVCIFTLAAPRIVEDQVVAGVSDGAREPESSRPAVIAVVAG